MQRSKSIPKGHRNSEFFHEASASTKYTRISHKERVS
jgi:hypothetical protein